jgi:hypothetical protein
MVKSRRPQADRFAALKVGRNDIEAATQLAEIIGTPEHAEGPAQVLMQPGVVEKPGRCGLGQHGQGFQQALVVGIAGKTPQRFPQKPRNCRGAPEVFTKRRSIEHFRVKRVYVSLVLDENPAQLRGGHLVGQVGRHEGPGTDPDIDVQIIEVDAIQSLIKGPKCPHFVDSSERASPAKGESYAGVLPPVSRAVFRRFFHHESLMAWFGRRSLDPILLPKLSTKISIDTLKR